MQFSHTQFCFCFSLTGSWGDWQFGLKILVGFRFTMHCERTENILYCWVGRGCFVFRKLPHQRFPLSVKPTNWPCSEYYKHTYIWQIRNLHLKNYKIHLANYKIHLTICSVKGFSLHLRISISADFVKFIAKTIEM